MCKESDRDGSWVRSHTQRSLVMGISAFFMLDFTTGFASCSAQWRRVSCVSQSQFIPPWRRPFFSHQAGEVPFDSVCTCRCPPQRDASRRWQDRRDRGFLIRVCLSSVPELDFSDCPASKRTAYQQALDRIIVLHAIGCAIPPP